MVQRWNVCAIVFWRVVWYRAGTFLLCDHVRARRGRRGRDVPGCGRAVAWPWLWCPLSLCRRRVVATRRRMLVFAMVLVWSVLTQLALRL